MEDARNNLQLREPAQFGVELRQNVVLASYTTIKVGGLADYFATVNDTEQLLNLVCWARKVSLPYFILGGGSNILISDTGVRGLVIHNRCRKVRVDESHTSRCLDQSNPYLFAESGAAMAGVARWSIRAGLSGFEWAVSVPGTVGGAVFGNAGAHGGEVKDSLANARLVDKDGQVREYTLADFAYSYRNSTLKQVQIEDVVPNSNGVQLKPTGAAFNPVLLSANFCLPYGDMVETKARADGFLSHRRRTQPVEASLGSTFMNPVGDFAGRLIESAGLKGMQVGGAKVSQLHANFITNPDGIGGATANDIMALIETIQEKVERESGIKLIPEVQLVGER